MNWHWKWGANRSTRETSRQRGRRRSGENEGSPNNAAVEHRAAAVPTAVETKIANEVGRRGLGRAGRTPGSAAGTGRNGPKREGKAAVSSGARRFCRASMLSAGASSHLAAFFDGMKKSRKWWCCAEPGARRARQPLFSQAATRWTFPSLPADQAMKSSAGRLKGFI